MARKKDAEPDLLEKAVASYKANPEAWRAYGVITLVVILVIGFIAYTVVNQRRDAREMLTPALDALTNDNYREAAERFGVLESGYRFSGLSKEASFFEGAALYGLSRPENAEEKFIIFSRSEPGSPLAPQALIGAGRCREEMGDPEGALELYREAYENYSGDYAGGLIEIEVARLLDETGDHAGAASIYEGIASDTESLWGEIARTRLRLQTASTEGET